MVTGDIYIVRLCIIKARVYVRDCVCVERETETETERQRERERELEAAAFISLWR